MPLTSPAIKSQALASGFDLCGVARATNYPELSFLAEWLARGYAGNMGYLHRSARRRADVRRVMPSVRSVISLGVLYNTDRPYSIDVDEPDEALICRYAWGEDYHAVIGKRLDALIDWMRAEHGAPFEARPCVDTKHVQERVYAQHAGLGWIGKNTCLINPEIGSWVFLAEVLCSLELEPDAPAFDQCGECSLCLQACPTGALVEPRVLDARRCISYLTIEHRAPLPDDLAGTIGTHVYGCDICQEVCPWNQVPPVSSDPAWQPRPVFDRPSVDALAALDDAELERAIDGSAMVRAGATSLRRNVAAAQQNRRAGGRGV